MGVGRSQIGRNGEEGAPRGGTHLGSRQWIDQVRRLDFDLLKIRRIPAQLLKGNGENLAILQAVSGPQNTPAVRQPVGESESRRQIVAVAVVRNVGAVVDLDRTDDGLIAQSVIEREVGKSAPVIAGVI